MSKKNRRKTPAIIQGEGSLVERFFDQLVTLHLGYTILLAVGFAGSFIVWWYVFVGMKSLSAKILITEAVIHGVIVLAYLYKIFFVGYDDRFWVNFRNISLAGFVLSMITFFVMRLSFIGNPADMSTQGFYSLMRIISTVLVSLFLSLLPSLIVAIVLWFFIGIIQFFTGS